MRTPLHAQSFKRLPENPMHRPNVNLIPIESDLFTRSVAGYLMPRPGVIFRKTQNTQQFPLSVFLEAHKKIFS